MSKLVKEPVFNAQFLQDYENCLIQNSIKPEHIHWYVNWCQQFSRFIGTLPVTDCKPEHVSAFLDTLRDNPAIKDWQTGNAAHAAAFVCHSPA